MKKLFVFLAVTLLFSLSVRADSIDPFGYFLVYSAGDIGTDTQAYGSDYQGTLGAAGDVYFSGFTSNVLWRNDYGTHVGGNATLTGGSYYRSVDVGGDLYVQSLDIQGDVYVGGDASGSSGGTINGDLNVGGSNSLPSQVTVNGSVTEGYAYEVAVDFDEVTGYFKSISSYYANYADTVGYENYYGNLRVTLSSGLNVITMTAAEFQNAWGLTISGDTEGGSLVINLTGNTASLDSTTLSGIDSSKVLLNYVGADYLSITGGNTLNILAINSDVNFAYGEIWGNLVVGNLVGRGQVNDGYFDVGDTDWSFDTGGGSAAIPEPTTLAVFGVGLLLVWLRKRKRTVC